MPIRLGSRTPSLRFLAFFAALMLMASACSDDDAGDTTATAGATVRTAATTTEAPTTTAAVTTPAAAEGPGRVMSQVGFDTDFQDGWVIVENKGSQSVSLGGHWLCQGPSCFELPDVTLEPGDAFWVAASTLESIGVPEGQGVAANGGLGVLRNESGEIAFYSSNSFGDPSAIIAYVEWGESGHGRSTVAVEAGVWPAGGFVETTGPEDGAIDLPIGSDPTDPFAWEIVGVP